MIENPELRAKILDWQKRYNIQDGDPAIALLELVEFMGRSPATTTVVAHEDGQPVVATAQISSDSLADAMKTGFLPVIERMSYQAQELHQKLDLIDFDKFVKQIETYHEGIDYCTKKLDVVKKETDNLIVKVEKAAGSIRPILNTAVLTLVVIAFIVGYVVAKVLF